MEGLMNDVKLIRQYALAGKAVFTIVSGKTKKRYTYRINRAVKDKVPQQLWFVSIMYGTDNYKHYSYIGVITTKGLFKRTEKSRYSELDGRVIAFRWWWKRVDKAYTKLTRKCDTFHSGHCGRCGKRLTVPKSILNGLGPICNKYITGRNS